MRLFQRIVGQKHPILDNDAGAALLIDPEAVEIVAEGQNAVELSGKILRHHEAAADLLGIGMLGNELHAGITLISVSYHTSLRLRSTTS